MVVGMVTGGRAGEALYTNVYVVPPTFLRESPEHRDDPVHCPTAKTVLESAGITFPEGASAIYNPATSQLIVRNTQDQMELVEAYIESIRDGVEKQIYVSVREARFRGELADLLKSANSESLPGGAGLAEDIGRFFDLSKAEEGPPSTFDSRESFRAELARPPKPIEELREEKRIRMTGVTTDPQFQVMVRLLAQVRGVDLESLPSVMVRSGQPGMTRKEGLRYGFVAVLGADGFTIDLELFLPEEGKAFYDPETTEFEPTASVTIWDGQTVVVAEKNPDGRNRLVFVTARLMDPAGIPIHRNEPAAKQEEAELPGGGEKESEEKRADEVRIHRVREGETLEVIAGRFGIAGDSLRAANGLLDDVVKPEQILLVPWVGGEARTKERLATLILPGVDLKEASLVEAIALLQEKIALRHDPGPSADVPPIVIAGASAETLSTKITLRLVDVPASEALRYVAALANCRCDVVGSEVRISPAVETKPVARGAAICPAKDGE